MTAMSDQSHAGLAFANVTALFGLGPPRFPSTLGAGDVTASSPYSPVAATQAYDAAFYSGLGAPENVAEAWRCFSSAAAAASWSYDAAALQAMGAAYPYPSPYIGGVDVRRKNATRESTGTLKAWLMEHIKNPYPTKGEKVMLAIVTKMTLTQVSTWFANARRRLKKENKMQWSPRNRTGDDCDDDDDDDFDDDVINDVIDDGRRSDNESRSRSRSRLEGEENLNVSLSPAVRGIAENGDVTRGALHCASAEADDVIDQQQQQPMKPRIWSLVDVIASSSPPASASTSALLHHRRPSPLTVSSSPIDQRAEGVASLAYYKQLSSQGLGRSMPYDYNAMAAMAARYYEQLSACTGLLNASNSISPSSSAASSSSLSFERSRSVSPVTSSPEHHSHQQ